MQTQPGLGGSKTGSSSRPRGARHLLEPSGGDRAGARCPGQEEEQSPFPFRPSRGPGPHCGLLWSWPALLGPLCTACVSVSSSALCLLPARLLSSFLCWSCRAVLGSRAQEGIPAGLEGRSGQREQHGCFRTDLLFCMTKYSCGDMQRDTKAPGGRSTKGPECSAK